MTEQHDPAPANSHGPLEGFTVVLTSDRRSEEFAAALERRGATVLRAPVLRIVPTGEDAVLEAATQRLVEHPPDDVVVTTAIGFRGWIEAADAHGQADDLLRVLAGARILARGPKGRGAIRAAGLSEAWSAASETTAEVVEHLLAEGVRGRRIAVQQHGLPDEELLDRLRAAGAELETFQVYRWGTSPDPAAVQRAVEAVCAGTADAVAFTSAPGSQAFLDAAEFFGRRPDVVRALRSDTVAAAVGPVTAEPLVAAGITPLVPDRSRLGALVRALADHLVEHHVHCVPTRAGVIELRGRRALLDGRCLPLSASPLAVLKALARRPGEVVDRTSLLAALPEGGDMHAVEVAVGRLRSGLGAPQVVETVVKRGYRLAL